MWEFQLVPYIHICYFVSVMQVNDGLVLPDKASLYLTAIEDADYKEDKIECELINMWPF